MSSPSRSFGSNHVDFGGMMAPASDTAIRSATPTGCIENATALCPRSTRAWSSRVPRAPPDAGRDHLRSARAAGTRRAVMAVSDVERGNPGEGSLQDGDVRSAHPPERVADAVGGSEVDQGLAARHPFGDVVDRGLRPV